MIRPGRLWWLLRRDLRRGWEATRQHYFTLPRIEEWSWPFWGEKPQDVPVHVLTGAGGLATHRLDARQLVPFQRARLAGGDPR